jgi:hypothetical protein
MLNTGVTSIICPKCSRAKDRRAAQCRLCKDKEPSTKTCKGCDTEFPITAFALRPNGRGGYKRRSRCKTCENTNQKLRRQSWSREQKNQNRDWKRSNYHRFSERHRQQKLLSDWRSKGFATEDILKFLESNKKECSICQSPNDLKIDHCHTTNKLRGFLCGQCNFGLGNFKDDPRLLSTAIDYLRRNL